MTILERAKKQIIDEVKKKTGIEIPLDVFSVPPSPEVGDIALPCFTFAKEMKKSPAHVAQEVAAQIVPSGLIASVQAAGPYINFYVAQETFSAELIAQILKQKKKFGAHTARKQKLLLEYSQPNTHKEFHVGHLRNAILGSAIANLFDALGYTTIRATYVNDFGAHIAKTLYAWLNQKTPAQNVKLGALYAAGVRAEQENPQAAQEIKDILRRFQTEGDKKLRALWKKTRAISMKEFASIYKELGVRFDAKYFESDLVEEGRELVNELMSKGVLKKSEGAIIADLTQYGLDVLVVIRSDGTSQYAVADLALSRHKIHDYHPDKAYWLVDVRQSLYFKQLIKILQLMGVRAELKHLPYEYVQLTTGALSSRTGNVLTYWDVRDQLVQKSISETKKRHADWGKKKIETVGTKIAIAALKFGMLKQHMGKIVTFDVDAALRFEGYTGPYIQYTVARVNSVLKKGAGVRKKELGKGYTYAQAEERDIINLMARYPELIASLEESLEPSHVAQYVFDLAQAVNTFYHTCPILQAEPPICAARLSLMRATTQVMENALGILGIPILKEM